LLVSCCAGDRYGMASSDKDRGRSRRPGDGHTGWIHGARTIGRSGDVVCGLHRACRDEERMFLG
jgi:hypothetical protein